MPESNDWEQHPARLTWKALEPYHAMIYFSPEASAAYKTLGLKGYWMGYFASRSASMGAVPAEVVDARLHALDVTLLSRPQSGKA